MKPALAFSLSPSHWLKSRNEWLFKKYLIHYFLFNLFGQVGMGRINSIFMESLLVVETAFGERTGFIFKGLPIKFESLVDGE